MNFLRFYLDNNKIKKILSKKPGEEGFSLVELVVVIAVLAILSAVAIPAFQGVQQRAKTSAVKNGLTNGVKECIVKYGMDGVHPFNHSQAYKGQYSSYSIGKLNGSSSCFDARATPDGGKDVAKVPWFSISYDLSDGTVEKKCGNPTGLTDLGCDASMSGESDEPMW